MGFEIRDYKLYLFDLDGTLMVPKSGDKFPQTVDDRVFMEGRWEHLLDLHAKGKKTALVTNQGGAAWGIFEPNDMTRYLEKVAKNADLDAIFVCYHDTGEKARNSPRTFAALTTPDLYKGEWDRRKPGPGMIIEALDLFQIDRHDTIMIGDRPEDQAAAAAAGVDFMWEWDYFKSGPIIA